MCVRIIVHNCHTQYSTEQFWLYSLPSSSRQSSKLEMLSIDGDSLSMLLQSVHARQL